MYNQNNQAFAPHGNNYAPNNYSDAPANHYPQGNTMPHNNNEQYPTNNPANYEPANNTNARPQQSDFDPDFAPGGKFYSIKVHGGSAAVEFKADVTRKGFKTIRIESAKGANKKFDWANKVSVQLTHAGLLEILNAFLFVKPEVELKHYGANNDKGVKVMFQSNKLFVQVSQGGKGFMGTPVAMIDAIRIGQFALDQYLQNFSNLTADVVVQHLKRAQEILDMQ
ncbi:hypothetical protein [uncultured Pseudoalteromonas sp.]|uniref:hypothetical protein n=1 Tax=uncultured Pseudoalteromonas sp. TaxID=114053 RepID=UPI002599ED03|nr:hypothetical protein [uncultured Pseudoalteromonas sp.]